MLFPFCINESYIDQVFNQNPISLLTTKMNPARFGFGDGVVKGENSFLQIRRLISITHKNQNNQYFQISFSKQFVRLTQFYQNHNPKPIKYLLLQERLPQKQYYFRGIRVLSDRSISAFIGETSQYESENFLNINKNFFDIKLSIDKQNCSLTYFYDYLFSQEKLKIIQHKTKIVLPNYSESYLRFRSIFRETYLLNGHIGKQPNIEFGFTKQINQSSYFSVLSKFGFKLNQFNYEYPYCSLLPQITLQYKGWITKLGLEAKFIEQESISPYLQMEMVLWEDPILFIKILFKNIKPSVQINFDYDLQKQS
ncbi:unnamed protein product [Paramecium sonneborni]|uniref:Uncharacterized protein n=1 Tax=Paramecium sonneborni TaxID=65129 RepID=A0A8S1KXF5_9CILI|nr:unnamed protein product [Paramecium sonneborni]